jgi:transcriptional regulator with XRE-family HTH domain
MRETQRKNIRAQRARLGLTQASVARRMGQLGYGWFTQTVGLVEHDKRPLLADELAALALALETTPDVLALPPGDVQSVLFGDHVIPAQRLSVIDDSVNWDGDDIKVTPPAIRYRPGEIRAVVDTMRQMLSREQEQGED